MYKNGFWLVLWLVASTFVITSTVYSADINPEPLKLNKDGHRWVLGTVEKVTPEAFFLKTREGTSRNYSLKELEKEGISNLRVGEFLSMEFDEGNQIIDIDRVNTLDLKPEEFGEFHHTVLGEVVSVDSPKKKVTLKVKGKGDKSYRMKDAAATKMAGIQAGTVVLLELDEENNMVNDFDIRR